MKQGFTGSRDGMTDYQKVMLEGLLDAGELRHGCCVGADEQACAIMRSVFGHGDKAVLIAYPGPKNNRFQSSIAFMMSDIVQGHSTFLRRNRDIVDRSDVMYACPKEMQEQERGGTWYTIRYARSRKVLLTIIYPDGSLGS